MCFFLQNYWSQNSEIQPRVLTFKDLQLCFQKDFCISNILKNEKQSQQENNLDRSIVCLPQRKILFTLYFLPKSLLPDPGQKLFLFLTICISVPNPSKLPQILAIILIIHGSFPTDFFGQALKIALLDTKNGPKNVPLKCAK